MLNHKKDLYVAGVFALCTLAACSSDDPSIAGSTTIPNATANNDSLLEANTITFKTQATAVTTSLQNLDIDVYNQENGAQAFCATDEREFTAKIKIDATYAIAKSLELKNFGSDCDSILEAFRASCGEGKIIVDPNKACNENGDVFAICPDYRAARMMVCTTGIPANCQEKEGDTSINVDDIITTFRLEATDACNAITTGASTTIWGWGANYTIQSSSSGKQEPKTGSSSSVEPACSSSSAVLIDKYGNPVTSIDTASYTLDNYTAQFTDSASELSFDSHVLAYSGIRFDLSGGTIKETSLDDALQNFPLTAAVAGERINTDNCKFFIVGTDDAAQPTGHVLSKISEGNIEITEVHPGGMCRKSAAYFTVAFLVKDCDGLIDENAKISYKTFTSETWACEEGEQSPTKDAGTYGEWYRADLRQ